MSEKKQEHEEKVKEPKTSEHKEGRAPLTEWQQLNLEFLKKKKQKEAEKEKQKKEERLEKLARYGKVPPKENIETKEDKKEKVKKKIKKPKKVKVKKGLTKRQRAVIKALPVIIVSFLLFMASLFAISPYSKKKTIIVKGSSHTTSKTVLKEAHIESSDYIFSLLLHPKTYENRLKAANPWVSSAKLSYQFPNYFTLMIKEYSVVGYIQTDTGYQPLLSNGNVVVAAPVLELPEASLTISLTDQKMLKELAKDLLALDKNLRDSIQSISLAGSTSTSDLLILAMRDGNTVRVPLSEMIMKLPYYSKIKDKLTPPAIVDMEVGIYATTSEIEAKQAEKTSDSSETQQTEEATAESQEEIGQQ